jgi:hypothetical protein
MMQHFESARLQQRLDLEDPVVHLKDRLTASLRGKLALTNTRIEPEALNIPIIARQAAEPSEDEVQSQAPESPAQTPREQTAKDIVARTVETFKGTHPSGAVIEIVTLHWGMADYRMKYAARVRLFDLAQSKVLLETRCAWIMFDQVDKKEMPPPTGYDRFGNYNPNVRDEYADAMEARLYADNGALLKASLRKAAELCADRVVGRFLSAAQPADQQE